MRHLDAARSAPGSLIAGAGPLHEPKLPDVPGLRDFEGTCSTRRPGTTTTTSPASGSP